MRVGLLALWLVGATACGQTAAAPTPVPTVGVPTLTPTQIVAVPSPSPVAVPTAAPVRNAAPGLATVETTAAVRGPGFLTPVELDLELEQPVTDAVDLKTLVEGVQQLDGVATVRSDGVHIVVRYDSTRVLPARLRDRLRELGHPARAGTEVQNPGDAAD
jgi:hypothetical protein